MGYSSTSTFIFLALFFLSLSGCGMVRELSPEEREKYDLYKENPPSQEQAKAILKDTGEDWLYGEGFGSTALNVGAMIIFPPYGLYVLGDVLLNINGYDMDVTNALPGEDKEEFNSMYEDVAGAPGRIAAAVAGREYRGKGDEESEESLEQEVR